MDLSANRSSSTGALLFSLSFAILFSIKGLELEIEVPLLEFLSSANSSSSLLLLPPFDVLFKSISSICSEGDVALIATSSPILSSWKANQLEFVNILLQQQK
ncbi:hypothetical protein Hanom_Chr14g01313111 [Helianthus anomalus]